MVRISRIPASLAFLACVTALATGLVAQYVFGYRPCILCYYQRIPYVVAAIFALLSLWPFNPSIQRFLLRLAGLAFAANAAIAFYHVGVEQHWWAFSACEVGFEALPNSPEALIAALGGPAPVRCDEIPVQFMGISLAGGNLIASVFLTIYVFVSTISHRRKGHWR